MTTAMTNNSAISDAALAEEAAQWIVLLTSDSPSERENAERGFTAWKQADARHAAAAAELEQFVNRLQGMREHTAGSATPASRALAAGLAHSGEKRTRRIASALALVLAIALPASVALQDRPAAWWLADMRSSSGEWQSHVLADGTRITLGSRTAVNLDYSAERRTVELLQGEILVDVAKDSARPFVVETRDGSIRALGTRFVVERETQDTVLSMLESRVAAQTAAQRDAASSTVTEVSAGQRVRISSNSISAVENIDARSLADAWKYHQLVVSNRPLPEVLDALEQHRPGRIHYDRAALQGILVSAVLPLDDSDRALQLLAHNFPSLRLRQLSPWLVLVDSSAQPEH